MEGRREGVPAGGDLSDLSDLSDLCDLSDLSDFSRACMCVPTNWPMGRSFLRQVWCTCVYSVTSSRACAEDTEPGVCGGHLRAGRV